MAFNYKKLGSGFLAELEYLTQKINSGLPPQKTPQKTPLKGVKYQIIEILKSDA